MATLREIRRRIIGVKSTQKITKAMKMVAAAKLRRAQDAVVAARPYARKMKELLSHLQNITDVTVHPLFQVREVNNVALVVITSDRGLCGAFNSNIIRTAVQHINSNYYKLKESGNVKLICIGKKGNDFFQKNNYNVIDRYIGIFQELNFDYPLSIMDEIVRKFMLGEFDKVEIIYNEFKSIIHQKVTIEQFLPIISLPAESQFASLKRSNPINYIYEPSSRAIVNSIIPKHLHFQLWRALLESNAAEQGARMTAMDNATTNASELIHDLLLSYNKARQAAITKELLEIVSGAEALKST
jgi:F-type H+-transporting ATPase subunit gamma